jgi:putative membrane protein insertion efficiency factor
MVSPVGAVAELGRRLGIAELPRQALLVAIRAYQLTISAGLPPACRFEPTCSRYAYAAVERHGLLRGGWLATRRLLRCHPWGGSGYDPVP